MANFVRYQNEDGKFVMNVPKINENGEIEIIIVELD